MNLVLPLLFANFFFFFRFVHSFPPPQPIVTSNHPTVCHFVSQAGRSFLYRHTYTHLPCSDPSSVPALLSERNINIYLCHFSRDEGSSWPKNEPKTSPLTIYRIHNFTATCRSQQLWHACTVAHNDWGRNRRVEVQRRYVAVMLILLVPSLTAVGLW